MMIHTEDVVLTTSGAKAFNGYLARPADVAAPGLIILSEMWGITDGKREMAQDYARKGWCTLVPNVFWRSERSGTLLDRGPERELAWERLRALDFKVTAADVGIASRWLRDSTRMCTGKIAALGFCVGGRIAYLAAATAALDGAIALYALGIANHLDDMGRITCPVQLHYGLADQYVPLEEIEAVTQAAQPFTNVQIYRYPGMGHGFFNPERPTHDAAVVALANQRIDALLSQLR